MRLEASQCRAQCRQRQAEGNQAAGESPLSYRFDGAQPAQAVLAQRRQRRLIDQGQDPQVLQHHPKAERAHARTELEVFGQLIGQALQAATARQQSAP